jgi:hypothetical protein
MQNTPILRTILGSLLLASMAPAVLAAPGATVTVDAQRTVLCEIHDFDLGRLFRDVSVKVDDCSATVHADTHNVSAYCYSVSTNDVPPAVSGVYAALNRDCTVTARLLV